MKKKILVTGYSGFLAMRIVQLHKDEYEFLTPTHSELDITNEKVCMEYVALHKPEVIIHCAAISNMLECESRPEESHRVNVDGAIHIAKACKAIGAKMIFASSDQVYNGSETGESGRETDDVKPKNLYGNQKLTAEKAVKEIADGICLRLSWMCDKPSEKCPEHLDFYSNLMRIVREKEVMKYWKCDRRSITNVNEVAENIFHLFDMPGGSYNFAATGNYNQYEIAHDVIRGLYPENEEIWQLIQADDSVTEADGRNITMSMEKVMSHGIHFEDSVQSILNLEK